MVGDVVEVEVPDHHRAAGMDEVLGVLRLVVGGRERVRHEDRRLARRCDLPDRAAGARDARDRRPSTPRRSGRSTGSAGSRPARAGSSAPSSRARPRCAASVGPTSANASIAISLIERAPASAPATSSAGPSAGSSKISRASSFGIVAGARRDRPADDAEPRLGAGPRAGTPGRRAWRTRSAIRFASPRCASASESAAGIRIVAGREDHRPRDIAPGAEDDVAAAALQDRPAGVRRDPRPVERI